MLADIPRTVTWTDGELRFLDQRLLPLTKQEVTARTVEEAAVAIETMQVRGAPLIGVVAGYGICLAAREGADKADFSGWLEEAHQRLRRTRPTAVNLFWALDRMMGLIATLDITDRAGFIARLDAEATAILEEDVAGNVRMGDFGAALFDRPVRMLTHCNAGALATGGWGTALGVIRSLHRQGKLIKAYADETRPLLQGARITAFEFAEASIPYCVLTDNMAAHVLSNGMVDAIVTGADRVTANGDAANKIGTHGLAIIAREYNVPFYIAAPASTFDLSLKTGAEIVIEERHHDEVRCLGGVHTTPVDAPVFNPAFDVTPARLIRALITEHGVIEPPFEVNIPKVLGRE